MSSGVKSRMTYVYPLALGAVAVASAPLFGEYTKHVLILVFFWSFMASAWNIIGGYCGQYSFCNGMYAGVGAYATAYIALRYGVSPWIGMLVGVMLAGAIAWVIGWVLFRSNLKDAYFALVTLAITEVAVYIISNMRALGGSTGMSSPTSTGLYWLNTNSRDLFYAVAVLMAVFALLLTQYQARRRFFYYLQAIREDEDAAEALGVDTIKEKIRANVMSAVLCALGGVFYLQYFQFVDPRGLFGGTASIKILLFAVVGGLGTVWGPLAGAALLIPISEIARAEIGSAMAGADLLVYGLAMVLVMLFMPRGLLGIVQRVRQSFLRSRQTAAVSGPESADSREG